MDVAPFRLDIATIGEEIEEDALDVGVEFPLNCIPVNDRDRKIRARAIRGSVRAEHEWFTVAWWNCLRNADRAQWDAFECDLLGNAGRGGKRLGIFVAGDGEADRIDLDGALFAQRIGDIATLDTSGASPPGT